MIAPFLGMDSWAEVSPLKAVENSQANGRGARAVQTTFLPCESSNFLGTGKDPE